MAFTLHGPSGQVKAYPTQRTPAQQAEVDSLRSQGWGLGSYTAPTTSPAPITPTPNVPVSPADGRVPATTPTPTTTPTDTSTYGRYLTPEEAKSGTYAGKTVTIPGSGIRFKSAADDPQQQIQQINQDANAAQDKELALINTTTNKVDLSASSGLLENLTKVLADESTRQATTPSVAQTLADQRGKLGIDATEASLNKADADLKALDNNYTTTTQQEETRQVGLTAVRRRQDAVTLEYNRQRRDLVAERDSLANQVNQKYSVINTMMTATNMDIDNARQDYQTKFTSAVSLINIARGIEQDQLDANQKKSDNARANLVVMQNVIKDGGKSYADLPESTKLDIKQMEMSAGLPIGITSFVTATVQEPIIHWGSEFTDRSGNRVQPITTIDKKTGNMVTKNIMLGKEKGPSYQAPSSYNEWSLAGGLKGTGQTYAQYLGTKKEGTQTEAETKRSAIGDMSEQLNTKVGGDGYVAPSSFKKARKAWGDNGYTDTDFLISFKRYVDPSHYADYGITATDWIK